MQMPRVGRRAARCLRGVRFVALKWATSLRLVADCRFSAWVPPKQSALRQVVHAPLVLLLLLIVSMARHTGAQVQGQGRRFA